MTNIVEPVGTAPEDGEPGAATTTIIARLMDAAIFLLLLVILWSLDTIAGAGSNPLEMVRYAIIIGLEAIIVALAVLQGRRTPVSLRLSTGGGLLVLFMAYTVLSVFWSAGGTQSVLKVVLLASTIGTCLAIATLRPTRVLVQLLLVGCGAFVAIGALVSILVPSIGVETGWGLVGKWRGISTQKNNFGGLVALSLVYAIIQLAIPPATGRRRGLVLLNLLWAGLLVLCLLMSGSRGAQLSTAIGLAGLVFTRLRTRAQNIILVVIAIVAVPVLVLAVTTFSFDDTELNFAGLSFDTSSRTALWSFGLAQLGGRELLGFGPSGFWIPERLDVFFARYGWALDNFHSGYVTVLMEGGIVGFGLLISALVGCFSRLRKLTQGGDRWMTFTFSFFCIIVTENLVENLFGRSTDFLFLTFLLLMLCATAIITPSRHMAFTWRHRSPAAVAPPPLQTESPHG